ncbi:hypothetical protein QAD02_000569 [Eretmocerus hayati]|uniref:Uncharacterized protein n=1 Tax=Eretmocerus hayati TaxID=131215 RepID=A0ACC2NDR2_9HYME|nr:hypothetical protein QAD02_000569 [Eretmocerus hayati]
MVNEEPSESDHGQQKKWTEDERLALAAKLDKELDEYIDGLDKKSYSDGWPEDRWQEEMEKHPFFMKEMPENPLEMSPLMEGLQQLKYSEEYNTPNELALNYKEDGNFNYKHKKYRLAILCFTKGISTKCEDQTVLAQLYSNRALAQFKLQNYRSSLNDCKQALKLDPNYLKPLHTAAKCCLSLKDYEKCIEFCDQILNNMAKEKKVDDEITGLRAQAVKEQKSLLRNNRLREAQKKKLDEAREKIKNAIKTQGVKTDDSDLFHDSQCHVHLDENGLLSWPVIFAYPETNQTDFIQEFNQSTLMREQLEVLFEEAPSWDRDKRYQVDRLNVYFDGSDGKVYKVDVDQSLGKTLQHHKMIVKNGTPWFYVLVANSKEESTFLSGYK